MSDVPPKPFGFIALFIAFCTGMSLAWALDDQMMRKRGTCLQQIVLNKGCDGKVIP